MLHYRNFFKKIKQDLYTGVTSCHILIYIYNRDHQRFTNKLKTKSMEKTQLTPKEVYKIDEVVDFKIKAVFNNYCEVIDEKTGITSYLQSTAKL